MYNTKRMFKALFYPREVKSDTDNFRASVTNSISDSFLQLLPPCHLFHAIMRMGKHGTHQTGRQGPDSCGKGINIGRGSCATCIKEPNLRSLPSLDPFF